MMNEMPWELDAFIPQAGAIPFRRMTDGTVQVLLIRRLPDGRWSIPKGLIDPGHTARQAAGIEAIEEAGVEGVLSENPIGEYTYPKYGGVCRVSVFRMEVNHIHDQFPEGSIRERRWCLIDEAIQLLPLNELKAVVTTVGALSERSAEFS